MKIGYCELCRRDVPLKKKFNWILFLILCCTVVGGGVYIVWYLLFASKNRCPICNNKIKGKGKAFKEAEAGEGE